MPEVNMDYCFIWEGVGAEHALFVHVTDRDAKLRVGHVVAFHGGSSESVINQDDLKFGIYGGVACVSD